MSGTQELLWGCLLVHPYPVIKLMGTLQQTSKIRTINGTNPSETKVWIITGRETEPFEGNSNM